MASSRAYSFGAGSGAIGSMVIGAMTMSATGSSSIGGRRALSATAVRSTRPSRTPAISCAQRARFARVEQNLGLAIRSHYATHRCSSAGTGACGRRRLRACAAASPASRPIRPRPASLSSRRSRAGAAGDRGPATLADGRCPAVSTRRRRSRPAAASAPAGGQSSTTIATPTAPARSAMRVRTRARNSGDGSTFERVADLLVDHCSSSFNRCRARNRRDFTVPSGSPAAAPLRRGRAPRCWRARSRPAASRAARRSPPTDAAARSRASSVFERRGPEALGDGRRAARRRRIRAAIPRRAPPIAPLPIDRQAPRHPHQPGPEPLAIAQLAEAPVRLDERFLRHVLGVLPVPQHAVGDAKRQRGRLDQPRLEFALELPIHGHEATSQPGCLVMHRFVIEARRRRPPAGSVDAVVLECAHDSDPPGCHRSCWASGAGVRLSPSRRSGLRRAGRRRSFARCSRTSRPATIDGPILFHEHLSIRYPLTKALAEAQGRPVPVSFSDDVDLMIAETKAAGADGVRCIVDGGHPDMDRDLDALKRIAAESGVHIVASGGFYMQRNYPADIATKTRRSDRRRAGARREGAAARRVRRDRPAGRRADRRRAEGVHGGGEGAGADAACRSSRTTPTPACASRTRRSRWTRR